MVRENEPLPQPLSWGRQPRHTGILSSVSDAGGLPRLWAQLPAAGPGAAVGSAMWSVCGRKWNLSGRMGAPDRNQTHSQARHAPGAALQWPRLPSVVTGLSRQLYFTGKKYLKIASDMTNWIQNVAFSCHLAAFTLVVGRWFKEVQSKYLDCENTFTAPCLCVYIWMNHQLNGWLILEMDT